mmetsp:Transcript_22141/g.40716  ORF Transcript_22141/g.40716 Transcript_22141/m.40716 type:complete len:101 (-) Transcript_22141:295-597(-)
MQPLDADPMQVSDKLHSVVLVLSTPHTGSASTQDRASLQRQASEMPQYHFGAPGHLGAQFRVNTTHQHRSILSHSFGVLALHSGHLVGSTTPAGGCSAAV